MFKRVFLFTLFVVFITHITADMQIKDIPLPLGYKRVPYQKDSFSDFIINLSLKKDKIINDYRGNQIYSDYKVLGVVDMPLLFDSDLEQCADFAMRFWGDYHRMYNRTDQLYLYTYEGEKVYFEQSKQSYENFLKRAFLTSNSYSLKKGCVPVTGKLQPGDLIVQNETGGIGHVSVILDVCENAGKKQLYLIGYSNIPAQDFHIERAPFLLGKRGWFTLKGFHTFLALRIDVGKPVYRRFF